MNKIIFDPWIGSRYESENHFGRRVLVLGESHYGEVSETRPTFTKEIIKRLGQDERSAFFTKVAKVLLDFDADMYISYSQRSEIWEDVAFYNYIPGFVSEDARVRPSSEQWESAPLPFKQVIDMLKPQFILVLGKELGAQIPIVDPSITVCVIQHPSTGFSYEVWNPVFKKALSVANNS